MSFTLDLKKAVKNINKNTERVVRGTLFSLSNRIIEATPVGNPSLWKSPAPPGYIGGTLRAAWNASIGTPDLSLSTSTAAQTAINQVASTTQALKIGQTFYLTNPQPYAWRVEYGWSSQRPQGMVRVNVAQTQNVINGLS